ncbi:MAG TPA: hypothetical protein V6C81_16875 [Planktothrix sp.]|jgi:hypothetical protein
MNGDKLEQERQKAAPIMPNEACDIGDEQMPGGVKTDKAQWNYCADKVKREPILPQWFRDFLAGL